MPIVFRQKCPKCGKYIKPMVSKCPYCGVSLIKVYIKEKASGVAPHVLLLDKSKPPKLERQSDLVKDYGFPDVVEEIKRIKEKKRSKE